MHETGKYIYGIIPRLCSGQVSSNEEKSFGTYGLIGEDAYTISYQDIAAVVSDSKVVDYTKLRKDMLARLLVNHQTVIEKIMAPGNTIIPMRFGTNAQDKTEVKEILTEGYNLIRAIFEKIKDKVEIDVAATWIDFNSVIKEAGEGKEIKELKEKLLSNPKGINTDDQIKIGFIIKKELDKRKDNYGSEIQETLKTVSLDYKIHDLMDDKMVIDIAFLIDKAKREDFDKKVEELNIKFNEKLKFRCVGPLPPYSFYTLETKKIKFEKIDWARKKLRFSSDSVRKDEIKQAYNALAFSLHPDKNPDTPGTEKEFDEVNKAYKILWEYCQKDSCSFKEDEFKKNAILVKVIGS